MQERVQRLAHALALLGRPVDDPTALLVAGDGEEAQLAHEPAQRRGGRDGQEDAGEPAQGRLADGEYGVFVHLLAAQPDGFQGADITRHEGENGDAEAALDEDAKEGQLQDAWRGVLGAGGPEELAFPAPGEVG